MAQSNGWKRTLIALREPEPSDETKDANVLDRFVCQYSLPDSQPELSREEILSRFQTEYEGPDPLVGVGANCPDFQAQDWTYAEDTRRLRALRQIHRHASGGAFDPGALSTKLDNLRIYVLDSVSPSYAQYPNESAAVSLLATDNMPASLHGVTVASILFDSACGDDLACRSSLQLRHRQVLTEWDGREARGSYGDLANGLVHSSIPHATRRLINLSVADTYQKGEPTEIEVRRAFIALDKAKTASQIAQAHHKLAVLFGAPRFLVINALLKVWCVGGTVLAAAGNTLPPESARATPSFPASLYKARLKWPNAPLCSYLTNKPAKPSEGGYLLRQEGERYPLIHAVAASDHQDARLAISNGSQALLAHGLAVAAPNAETGYEVLSGTSAATATVTGLVARAMMVRVGRGGDDVLSPVYSSAARPASGDGTQQVADLCLLLRETCNSMPPEPACTEWLVDTTCQTAPDIAASIERWEISIYKYVESMFVTPAIPNEVGLGPIGPQPSDIACPRKYCGVYGSYLFVRVHPKLTAATLVKLELSDGTNNETITFGDEPLRGGEEMRLDLSTKTTVIDWAALKSADLTMQITTTDDVPTTEIVPLALLP